MQTKIIEEKTRKLNNLQKMVVRTTGEMREVWINKWCEMISHIRKELGLKIDG